MAEPSYPAPEPTPSQSAPEPTQSVGDGALSVSAPPLWRHQRAAVERILSLFRAGRRGALVAAAMGTGKSAMALTIARALGARRVLILCPLRVVRVWPAQIERHATGSYIIAALDDHYRSTRVKAAAAVVSSAEAHAADAALAIICNYESAWREPLASWLLGQQWDLIICDEIHRLKAPGGRASRYVARLGSRARYRLGLTGTPMPHSPLDVYGYFRFLDPQIFGWRWANFRDQYAIMGGYQNHQVVGFRNLEDLHRRYYSVTYACGQEVLELPPTMTIEYTCSLGAEARRIYRQLERDLVADVREGRVTAANALVRLLRLAQLTGGCLRTDDGRDVRVDDAKQELLADVLEDLPAEEPVVVFCRFRADLDAVHSAARSTGRASLELSGRRDELAAWQAGDAPVLAVQVEAGGLGIDLTRARYAIYYSVGYSLGAYEQSLARVHRPGQTRPVTYIHLLAEHTVDEQIMAALERRADIVQAVLAGMTGEDGYTMRRDA